MPKFLFKANNDVLSHCSCENEPGSSTHQLDCPWCGCGWLISCSKCGKAFTFAVIAETDTPLIELGRREVQKRGLTNVTQTEIEEWAEAMAEDLDRFEVGQIVVYFDGSYFPIEEKNVEFDGYFASHKLDELPHARALRETGYLYDQMTNKSYWLERELPDRD